MGLMSARPADAAQWMKPVLDQLPIGVLVESDQRIHYINDAYARLLGYSRPARLIDLPIADVVHSEDRDRLVRFGRLRSEGKQAPNAYDFAARDKDGTGVRLQATVSVTVVSGRAMITTFVRPFELAPTTDSDQEIDGPHHLLSPRERQVMDRILAGDRMKTIALNFGLSEKTVATHRTRLLSRMGLADNRDLFRYAVRHRLVDWR